MTRCRIKCPGCGTIDEFEVPRSALSARGRGKPHEEAFAGLAQERRDQLRDHVCPDCREKK